MKEHRYISIEISLAVVLVIGPLLWAMIFWPSSVLAILKNMGNKQDAMIAFCVPGGVLGLIGLFILGMGMATGRKDKISKKIILFVVLGNIVAVIAGLEGFFKEIWSTIFIIFPILVSSHLLYLYFNEE